MIPTIWEQEDLTGNDPWCKFRGAIEKFNHIRKLDILSSELCVLDESMSVYRPCTSKYTGLPDISYIIRKPEPLGMEFKKSVFHTLNIMTYMEVCKEKESMKNKPCFHFTLGATTVCTVHMTQGTCQCTFDNKVETEKTDSWFGSVKSVVKIKTICPQEKEAIFSVKTVHKLFPKQFLEETLKEETGGSSKLQVINRLIDFIRYYSIFFLSFPCF
jgi:hypothetical protein